MGHHNVPVKTAASFCS